MARRHGPPKPHGLRHGPHGGHVKALETTKIDVGDGNRPLGPSGEPWPSLVGVASPARVIDSDQYYTLDAARRAAAARIYAATHEVQGELAGSNTTPLDRRTTAVRIRELQPGQTFRVWSPRKDGGHWKQIQVGSRPVYVVEALGYTMQQVPLEEWEYSS